MTSLSIMQPSHLIRSEKVLKMAPFDRSEKGATARKPEKKEEKKNVRRKEMPGRAERIPRWIPPSGYRLNCERDVDIYLTTSWFDCKAYYYGDGVKTFEAEGA